MKKQLILGLSTLLFLFASAQASALIFQDPDGSLWDCNWQNEVLICMPLDHDLPIEP